MWEAAVGFDSGGRKLLMPNFPLACAHSAEDKTTAISFGLPVKILWVAFTEDKLVDYPSKTDLDFTF